MTFMNKTRSFMDKKDVKAIKEMVKNLRKAQKKNVPQDFGNLLKITSDGTRTYCALGTLFCQKKQIEAVGNYDGINTDRYMPMLIELYGISSEFANINFTDELNHMPYNKNANTFVSTCSVHFDKMIFNMNDLSRLTFGEIADFLETTFLDGIE